MKNILPKSPLLLLLVSCFASQTFGQATTAKPDGPAKAIAQVASLEGHLDGVNYNNDFFGLSFKIPADWIVVSGLRSKEILDKSKELVEKEEAKQRADFEKSIERSTVLLSLTRLPQGAPKNASFLVVAERIIGPIRNGVQALQTMENMTKNTSFLVEFQGGIKSETINGVEFGVATIQTTSGGNTLKQKVYMMVKNGYGLEFFFGYRDAAELSTLDSIMKTVKIKS